MRAHMVFWVGVSLLRLSGPSCPGDDDAILGAPSGQEAVVCVCAEAAPARGLTITHATWDGKASTLTRVALAGNAAAAVALGAGNDPLEPAGAAHAPNALRHGASSTLVVLVVLGNRSTAEHGAAWEYGLPWRRDSYACHADLPGGVPCDDGIDDDCACDGKRNGFDGIDAFTRLVIERDGARRERGGPAAPRHAPLSSAAYPRAR